MTSAMPFASRLDAAAARGTDSSSVGSRLQPGIAYRTHGITGSPAGGLLDSSRDLAAALAECARPRTALGRFELPGTQVVESLADGLATARGTVVEVVEERLQPLAIDAAIAQLPNGANHVSQAIGIHLGRTRVRDRPKGAALDPCAHRRLGYPELVSSAGDGHAGGVLDRLQGCLDIVESAQRHVAPIMLYGVAGVDECEQRLRDLLCLPLAHAGQDSTLFRE